MHSALKCLHKLPNSLNSAKLIFSSQRNFLGKFSNKQKRKEYLSNVEQSETQFKFLVLGKTKHWTIPLYLFAIHNEYQKIRNTDKNKMFTLKNLGFSLITGAILGGLYVFLGINITSPFSSTETLSVSSGTQFKDICGHDEAKEELEDIVQFLKDPSKFEENGAKIPKGILLYGPPGVGKTLLAKALAGEANVNFIILSGGSINNLFVGSGAKKIRNVFETAKNNSPCIIFIDEIDGLSHSKRILRNSRQTITQLLAEMDGFTQSSNIVVLAATNRPEKLDPALLRSGRFDRKINLGLPDLKTRQALFSHYLANKICHPNLNLNQLASDTVGITGADIASISNIAAMRSANSGKLFIEIEDLREAYNTLLMGRPKKSLFLDASVRERVALHEAGHALAAILYSKDKKVGHISIIPRGQALGVTNFSIKESSQYQKTMREVKEEIVSALGGYAAEFVMYGRKEVTSGISSDMKKATRLAEMFVFRSGLSKSLGPMVVEEGREQILPPGKLKEARDEVKELVESCFNVAVQLLREERSLFKVLAGRLLKFESLTSEEVEEICKQERVNGG